MLVHKYLKDKVTMNVSGAAIAVRPKAKRGSLSHCLVHYRRSPSAEAGGMLGIDRRRQ